VPLGQGWRYRKVPVSAGIPERAPWEPIGGLSGLYNAMIAPLRGVGLSSVFWYQGESNTGAAGQYRSLLEAMVAGWRGSLGDELPFIVVQLPMFGDMPSAPVESGWARVRDAQWQVARRDPLTGLSVALDAGDPADLHPANKSAVARRAADAAGVIVYGEAGMSDGFFPLEARRTARGVVLEFDPADDVPVVIGDRTPVAFELCGDDGCRYAAARLDGENIVLGTDAAGWASHVRYCWADASICNLYGRSGLPVGSFELPIPPN
jgi:sialate O-acetylesterase